MVAEKISRLIIRFNGHTHTLSFKIQTISVFSVIDEMLLLVFHKVVKKKIPKRQSLWNVLGLDKYIDKHPFVYRKRE